MWCVCCYIWTQTVQHLTTCPYIHNPWDYCMFLDKKTRVLTCSGAKRLRRRSTIIPPLLNTRSDGTLVAGTQRYFLATFTILGGKQFSEFSAAGWFFTWLLRVRTCSLPCWIAHPMTNSSWLDSYLVLQLKRLLDLCFLVLWRSCTSWGRGRIWGRRANWVTLGIWRITGMDDFGLQFKFFQLSVSNVGSFESRVKNFTCQDAAKWEQIRSMCRDL